MKLESDLLAVEGGPSHGFFTRSGGVSQGIFDSLNCGYGSGDDKALVTENRDRAARALGVADMVTCYQVHGTDVVPVAAPWTPDVAPKADAMVSRVPGIALAILTADCAPVLFDGGTVIGAAHAGWRGALGGVLEATVEAMVSQGAERARLRAAIGPRIGPDSYEVGPEFPRPFLDQDPANDRFFRPAPKSGHWLFDLAGYAAHRLTAAGVAAIDSLSQDTFAETDSFFSYRRSVHRDEPAYGRLVSAIALGS